MARPVITSILLLLVLFQVTGGAHIKRARRHVATNPDNIKVIVANPRTYPVMSNWIGGQRYGVPRAEQSQQYIPQQQSSFVPGISQQRPPQYRQQPSFNPGVSTLDSNNDGGSHSNNLVIGGIQNFGGKRNEGNILKIFSNSG